MEFLARFLQLRLRGRNSENHLLCFCGLAHETDDEAIFHWPRSRPEMDA